MTEKPSRARRNRQLPSMSPEALAALQGRIVKFCDERRRGSAEWESFHGVPLPTSVEDIYRWGMVVGLTPAEIDRAPLADMEPLISGWIIRRRAVEQEAAVMTLRNQAAGAPSQVGQPRVGATQKELAAAAQMSENFVRSLAKEVGADDRRRKKGTPYKPSDIKLMMRAGAGRGYADRLAAWNIFLASGPAC